MSHMNIDDFYLSTDGTTVKFFHLVMPKNCFGFNFKLDDLIM